MILHWDDAAGMRRDFGPIQATWTDLGLHSVTVGCRRIAIDAGGRSTPAHVHGGQEEIFWVLGGSGLSWQDGKTFEVGPDDCLVHLAGAEAHTLIAGLDGLDVLAFGERPRGEATFLPRAGVAWLYPSWVDAGQPPHPFRREADAGELELPQPGKRPPRIVTLADVPAEEGGKGGSRFTVRNLGIAAGSRRTGLRHYTLAPTKMGAPPHCHSAEEELFVVLDGEGALLLADEEHPVRRGSVVARPAGTRVAHAFLAGQEGLAYLAYGTREPNDITYYPRSGKVYLRGVGVIGRLEQLDYWEGET